MRARYRAWYSRRRFLDGVAVPDSICFVGAGANLGDGALRKTEAYGDRLGAATGVEGIWLHLKL